MITGAYVMGVSGVLQDVTAGVSKGLPSLDFAGFKENGVREMRTRVRAALEQSGIAWPMRRVSVTARTMIPVTATSMDLAVAMAVLVANGDLAEKKLEGYAFIGELSLSGKLRPTRGVLPMVMAAAEAKYQRVIVPDDNAQEALAASGIEVLMAQSLEELMRYFRGDCLLVSPRREVERPVDEVAVSLDEVGFPESMKRAAEIAVAGSHPTMLIGYPGTGKVLFARALLGLMPEMVLDERIEVTTARSVTGLLREGQGLVSQRGFRAPHHTASQTGLTGGGEIRRPGEYALAHAGVMFFDEVTEFPRESLESLQPPMRDGKVTIGGSPSWSYPAEFLWVGAMNPCPGGNGCLLGSCDCSEERLARHYGRVPQWLREQVKLWVQLKRRTPEEAARDKSVPGPTMEERRERVYKAQQRKASRENRGRLPEFTEDALLLLFATDRTEIVRRQVRDVACTIRDLDGSAESVTAAHVEEALTYVMPKRMG